jgi:hypothetical protein
VNPVELPGLAPAAAKTADDGAIVRFGTRISLFSPSALSK